MADFGVRMNVFDMVSDFGEHMSVLGVFMDMMSDLCVCVCVCARARVFWVRARICRVILVCA